MSAESGIKTFRDADGLWEGHDIMQVATPEGWATNRRLVLEFYNARRRQLHQVSPNDAHRALVDLESRYDTIIITQNVDNLHEVAGSTNIIHLHGELMKVRSEDDTEAIFSWPGDLHGSDVAPNGSSLRPHIVWFGEAVPELTTAIHAISSADIVMIIGTSMQVYPAASLTTYAPPSTPLYYIDPHPQINYELQMQQDRLTIVKGTAVNNVRTIVDQLLKSTS